MTPGAARCATGLRPSDARVRTGRTITRATADNQVIRPGYLEVTLSHPTLGRPLVIRHAYGTSIPHLEPDDVALVAVPRLELGVESEIATLVECAAQLRSEADLLEDAITERAEVILHTFVKG
jgi:type I restriction enzyme, S subunit